MRFGGPWTRSRGGVLVRRPYPVVPTESGGEFTLDGDSLDVTFGPSAGGTTVTITPATGTFPEPVTGVSFGGVAASSVSVAAGGGSLTCDTPAINAWEQGIVDVAVEGVTVSAAFLYTDETLFDAGLHTHMLAMGLETFESYATTAAIFSGGGGPWIIRNSGGDPTLDEVLAYAGSKSLRVTYDGGGGLGQPDANVGFEKKLTNFDNAIRNYWCSFYQYVPVGYDWASTVGTKHTILWRNGIDESEASGRITFSNLLTAELEEPYTIFGDPLRYSGAPRWHCTIGRATPPAYPDYSAYVGDSGYAQHLALTRKRPDDIADGQWHHITRWIRAETVLDAGDGGVGTWVDGEAVMFYDGEDAASPAYQKVQTRTFGLHRFAAPTIFNNGAPQAQFLGYDHVAVFRNTSEA